MKKSKVLITGRDGMVNQHLKGCLFRHGFEIIETSDKTHILQSLQNGGVDLAIIGSSRDGSQDGLEIARQIRRRDRKLPIIFITEQSSETQVLSALRIGINDYFKLPFSYEEVVTSVKRALAEVSGQSSSNEETSVFDSGSDQFMIGESSPIQEIKTYLHRIATTDSTVLISGETGTGKGLAAELIHRNSSRHKKPFVSVNCAALPESLIESELFGHERGAFTGASALQRGKFELASGGTVFLDEIGDMNLYAQTKILRTIEKKEVYRLGGKKNIPIDIRIIAATNREPERLMEDGEFRKDLYYRLNVARVHMPPLRDRKEDIPLLLDHYVQEMNRYFGRNVKGFTKDAINTLLYYNWPGNIRELKNVVEAAFINLPPKHIAFVELPQSFLNRLKSTQNSSASERDQVLAALFAANWNKSKAAQKLHWSRMTLYRKMAKYQIMMP